MEGFARRTEKSESLFRRAQRVMPSGSTRSPFYGTPYPFYAQRAEGCRVWDVDGNEYVDYVSNMGPLVLGHRHPAVEKAVADQVASIWCGAPVEPEIELAEAILKAFPMGDRLLFTPSGTEALMKLVRAARAASGKKKLAIDSGSFHGTSDSLSPGPGVPEELSSLVLGYRYNDEESFRKVIREARNELAAVVIEAILGPAGGVPPTRSFLRTVREETERYGITLIFDEVVTGFRLARGGISELYSVRPDAVALGKIIGGGFPVGAFLGPERLMREFSYSKAEF
ncbi:MAG: aminotransferase class III-fold pyridoxal phosphate-dependent enzyme, partial [Nitrososphaerales archaeon]